MSGMPSLLPSCAASKAAAWPATSCVRRRARRAPVLHGLQRAAGQQQRDDLRLRNRRLGEERQPRLTQGAAHVHARFHVGKYLDGADVHGRVHQQPAAEDQPAAFDVELARQRQVLAVLHLQLARGAGGFAGQRALGDAAGDVTRSGRKFRRCTLSPSVMVISLVTRKGSFSTSSVGPTSLSSAEGSTALVRSAGWMRASGILTSPLTRISRPAMRKSRSGEASMRASGTSTTRRFSPFDAISPYGRLSRHSILPELASVPAPALAVELNSRLLDDDARFHVERAQREVDLVQVEFGAGELDDAAGARLAQRAFEAQVGIEVPAGAIDGRVDTASGSRARPSPSAAGRASASP